MGELLTILDDFICKVEPEWKAMHRIADKYLKDVAAIYESAFKALRNSINVDKLQGESIALMADRIDWQVFEDNCDKAYELLGLILVDAGTEAAKYLSNSLMRRKTNSVAKAKPIVMPTLEGGTDNIQLTGVFNMRNPKAVQWATQHVGENIRQVEQSTKDGVKVIISDALDHGGHPYETARMIRQHIGLTEKQMKGILNYQSKLDEEGRSQAQVDRMVDAQIRRKIRARAVMIARTETIAASCAGQQLHWEDQMAKGYLNNQYFQKEWIVTPDDRLCPICAAMEGKRTDIDGVFDGGIKQPPLHVQCRCSTGIVERIGQTLDDYAATAIGQDWTKVDTLAGITSEVPTLPVRGNWGDVEYTDNLKAVDTRLAALQQQYPLKNIPMKSHGDWLLEQQAEWDNMYNTLLNDYKIDYPNTTDVIAREKVKLLLSSTPRPTEYNMNISGEYFKARIGINFKSFGANTTLEDTILERNNSIERMKKGLQSRMQLVANGNEATMIHEYGHALMNDKQLWSDSDFHKYYKSLSKEAISQGVSDYAATNASEFFAECFTEIHMPNPRPMALKAMKLVGVEPPMPTAQPAIKRARHALDPNYREGHVRTPLELVQSESRRLGTSVPTTMDTVQLQEMAHQTSAVSNYTQSDYIKIRRGELPDKAKLIEDYIEKSPKYDGTIYRGLTTVKDSKIANIDIGDVIDMNGISSWTSDLKVAEKFSRDDVDSSDLSMVFEVAKTDKGTSIVHLARFEKEKEVLVSAKAQYKVLSGYMDRDVYHVILEELT